MTVKHILVADKISPEGKAFLDAQRTLAADCITGLDEAALCAQIGKYHAVVVRSATTITAKVIDAAARLEVIGRAGIGVDNIDVQHATGRGIVVLNTPDANVTTTAELTLAHLFSLSRNLPQANSSMKAGHWERTRFMGVELAGKTLGIIGYGHIGRIVAARALALEMQVLAFDPFVTAERFLADGVTGASLEGLLDQADYVSLHCPLNDKTRNIMDADRLQAMKPGARLINCARGGLVDEDALYASLQSGHLSGAALDVFSSEPPDNSPLLTLDNVLLTPHLGASTREAQAAAGLEIAQQICIYLQTGEPINAINLPAVSSEELAKLQPYLALARRLGTLLGHLIPEPVRRFEASLLGEAAERDLHSIATEGLVGLLRARMSMEVNRVNAKHVAEQQGMSLIETRGGEHPDYHSALGLSVWHGDRETRVIGTLFQRRYARLIGINDYEIEAVLEGQLLVTRHTDQPGVIAALSNLLAGAGINISRMQLGIVSDSDQAIAVLGVSTPLDDTLMDELARIEAIDKAIQVSL
ncbi:MAG: phosphoglycerate dehydrogenase [Gammaproteobacteria bacterium]|nr:phosphoglycerate dehydrogenase [Gammaproteobacteria bacterium]MCY4337489.1 phosphoglycerate dehydrogenase [Gammaproteobacteria bacterium]